MEEEEGRELHSQRYTRRRATRKFVSTKIITDMQVNKPRQRRIYPYSLCSKRQVSSHNVEINNKGILLLFIHLL